MPVNAADVKRLREITDAPMMECKAALEEANGDMDRAQEILREKGKAAAAKRADRATAAGNVFIALSEDRKKVAGIVVESETDFVALNETFRSIVQQIGEAVLAHAPAGATTESVLGLSAGGQTIGEILEGAVGTIRENIKLTDAVVLTSTAGVFSSYVHHDRKAGAIVEIETPSAEVAAGKNVAMQIVAFPPTYLAKTEVPQDAIDAEIRVEKERAMNEGKPAEMAEKIAMGRINKEYFQKVVLLEQPFILDDKKSVDQYLAEEGKAAGGTIKILSYRSLRVGG
ncbi:MAG TPA: translation elongation factor Ts [Fimbriimonadaceae bacterium]|nr:translation elongation factor Ts [Fimbriimonadaceae bacterium]HRJ33812.1 translation elongation factor Ts [Fimbriimonadaceae bacterium]